MKSKSMKSSVALLCMGLVLGSSVIAGCSLVTTNYAKYYDAVAAKIEFNDGSKIELTRKDLRTAYANYGFNQYLEQGLTQEEAYSKTLDFLVSRKLAIRDAEERAKKQNPNDEILTGREKTYLFESTYEAMKSNISSYLSTTGSEKEEETEANSVTREKFERKAELLFDEQKNEYSLILPESEKSDIEAHKFWSEGNKDATTTECKEEIYSLMLEYIKDNPAIKDAYNKYLSEIKTSEKNLNLSTDAKSVYMREIERVYKILYESLMVNKYTNYMTSQTTNNVLIQDMLDLYSSKVRSDYATYYNEDQTDKIKEKSGEIYYFNDNINWFYVSHILIKFDDTTKREEYDGRTQQEQYNYLVAELEKADEETEYQYKSQIQKKIDDLYNNLTGIVRVQSEKDNNVYVQSETKLNAQTIFQNVKDALAEKNSSEAKAEKFDDLIYVYNEDPGMINADFNYIVGVDYKKSSTIGDEDVNYTVYSNWVSEFNKAAVSLYSNNNGSVGDVYDGLIKSSYGVHIMMYAGEAKNIFEPVTSDFKLKTSDIVTLRNTRVKAGSEKTYFDLMYEECVPSSSSIFESIDLDRLKSETKDITYYPQSF